MFFIITFLSFLCLMLFFVREQKRHNAKIGKLTYRIHVNGIRGKSSVTRLLAGVLREANINTIAKTTGSETSIITPQGEDIFIKRQGPANVFENVRVIQEHITDKTQAIIFECMAIQPRYQRFLEDKVMQANIGIITNVWEDHVAEMGHSLEDIAKSLSVTIPRNGYLLCAEENKKIKKILKRICYERNTKYIDVLTYAVSDEYIKNFHYFEHKENIALGLALADILNISEKKALKGMRKVEPDRGAAVIKKYQVKEKKYIWVNLFAANDRQSVMKNVDIINKRFDSFDYATTSLVNSRNDRPERAQQFVQIVTRDIKSDYVVTIGELEKQVVHGLNKNDFTNVISLARHTEESGKQLIDRISNEIKEDVILLLGLGNIHTKQAQSIISYLNGAKEIAL